ncbi:MAG: ATP-binding cassette domain-containing protein, partial [Planctomycetota bacterium]
MLGLPARERGGPVHARRAALASSSAENLHGRGRVGGARRFPRMRQRSTGGDQTIRIACEVRTVLGRATNRTAEVGSAFGLPPCERKVTLLEPVDLRLGPGRLIALVGPSGSGKTTALEALERRFPASCRVGAVSFPDGVAVVDRIAPG